MFDVHGYLKARLACIVKSIVVVFIACAVRDIEPTMFTFKGFLVAACIASTSAVHIEVALSGGNVTGKFGHPYGYGFLHEVSRAVYLPELMILLM